MGFLPVSAGLNELGSCKALKKLNRQRSFYQSDLSAAGKINENWLSVDEVSDFFVGESVDVKDGDSSETLWRGQRQRLAEEVGLHFDVDDQVVVELVPHHELSGEIKVWNNGEKFAD